MVIKNNIYNVSIYNIHILNIYYLPLSDSQTRQNAWLS